MADFTPQQKAVLASVERNNLVNAVSRTGKTTLLVRRFLSVQEKPGEYRAIYLTANAFATQRVLDHLQRITAQDWHNQLVGTLSEISCKLLQRYATDMSYSRMPKLLSDGACTAERFAARKVAQQIQKDVSNPDFIELWNQEYVERLRKKDVITPKSLIVEAVNLFVRRPHPSLTNVRLLVADDVHDFGAEELYALTSIYERMQQCFLAGNTNVSITDKLQDIDTDNWIMVATRDGFKTFPLSQSFTLSPNHGLFLHQLSAHNSKRIFETTPTFHGPVNTQGITEVAVPDRESAFELIYDIESKLQLGIRGQLMGVILRHVDEAREFARILDRPFFALWDKTRLWNRFEPPTKGIICTTPYEAPYLNLDYVIVPNCSLGCWPYEKERSMENCRRQLIRAVSSAKSGIFLVVPDANNNQLPSPFVSEGSMPKLVTRSTVFPQTAPA